MTNERQPPARSAQVFAAAASAVCVVATIAALALALTSCSAGEPEGAEASGDFLPRG